MQRAIAEQSGSAATEAAAVRQTPVDWLRSRLSEAEKCLANDHYELVMHWAYHPPFMLAIERLHQLHSLGPLLRKVGHAINAAHKIIGQRSFLAASQPDAFRQFARETVD